MVAFCLPCRHHDHIFSNHQWENMLGFLEVRFTNLFYDWHPLGFSQICLHWTSRSLSITFSFFYPGSHWGLCLCIPALVNCESFYPFICLSSFWGQHFALWFQFSDGSKESCWVLVCSACYLFTERVTASKLFTFLTKKPVCMSPFFIPLFPM